MTVGGIVLCGGKSTRMGRPKAWLPVGGEPMLARVVRVLAEVVSPVVVVAAAGQDLPELPRDAILVRDERPDRGPLEGLAAGMRVLNTESAYWTACDVPLLHSRFVKAVIERLGTHDAAVPLVGGRPHPLAAVVRVDTAQREIQRQLATHILAVRTLFNRLTTRWIDEAELRAIDPNLDSLRNVNTTEELAAINHLIDAASASGRAGP
jgi:molybdenum cofactor guanylyltransferase